MKKAPLEDVKPWMTQKNLPWPGEIMRSFRGAEEVFEFRRKIWQPATHVTKWKR